MAEETAPTPDLAAPEAQPPAEEPAPAAGAAAGAAAAPRSAPAAAEEGDRGEARGRPRRDPDTQTPGKIFVGGLSWDTTEEDLRTYFEAYGEVQDTVTMKDRYTGAARGFGFVTFRDPESAHKAVQQRHQIGGRLAEAKLAVPRSQGGGAPQPTRNKLKKVFVGGVPPGVTEDEFHQYFSQFGQCSEAQIIVDPATARPRGFGFVTFADEETVDAVMAREHMLGGKKVELKHAVPKASIQANRGRGYPGQQGGDRSMYAGLFDGFPDFRNDLYPDGNRGTPVYGGVNMAGFAAMRPPMDMMMAMGGMSAMGNLGGVPLGGVGGGNMGNMGMLGPHHGGMSLPGGNGYEFAGGVNTGFSGAGGFAGGLLRGNYGVAPNANANAPDANATPGFAGLEQATGVPGAPEGGDANALYGYGPPAGARQQQPRDGEPDFLSGASFVGLNLGDKDGDAAPADGGFPAFGAGNAEAAGPFAQSGFGGLGSVGPIPGALPSQQQ